MINNTLVMEGMKEDYCKRFFVLGTRLTCYDTSRAEILCWSFRCLLIFPLQNIFNFLGESITYMLL